MIAALFVASGGCYFGLLDVVPYDVRRDARKYAGPWRVVAHPPCSVWCQLARLIGDDGGCFASALASVRRWGGVLEHPAFSLAWPAHDLPRPTRGAWAEGAGGWVTEVSQGAYGHRARKRTWLYAVGARPADLVWSDPSPTATCSYLTNHGGGNLPRLTKREAKATPVAFRDALLIIAAG